MGQKINPLGFRLGTTQNHHSIWFEEPKKYCEGLQEDQKIRDCIKNYIDNHRVSPLQDLISRIQIEKSIDLVQVIIYLGFPALESEPPEIKAAKMKELKGNVEKVRHSGNRDLQILIRKIGNPYRDPKILAAYLADQLKQRVSFRKAM